MFAVESQTLRFPRYIRASMIAAIGGLIFGLDTGAIGPITVMSSFEKSFGTLSSSLHGVVVSSILIGGMTGALFSGNIADVYGRIPTITTGALMFGVGATLECGAPKLGVFIFGRILAGLGEGLFLGTTVVYICEISPAHRRGSLTSFMQFLTVFGLCIGFFLCYGTATIASSASWRVPLAIQAGICFVYAFASWFLPASPRWLWAKRRVDEAIRTLEVLDLDSLELEQVASHNSTTTITVDVSLWSSIESNLKDMARVFSSKVWKRTAIGCFLMAAQQLSGIDGVLYYAPLLFQQAGLTSSKASFLASGVSAIVMLAVTIPAAIFTDRVGRRGTTIYGGIGIFSVMLLIGSLYAAGSVHGDHGAARFVVIACIYIFCVIFCTTWAISIRLIASEIQPAVTRASATNLTQSANWIANFVVALTTPILLQKSSFAPYYMFSGFTLLAVVVCYLFTPETKGKTLEEIDRLFSERHVSIAL